MALSGAIGRSARHAGAAGPALRAASLAALIGAAPVIALALHAALGDDGGQTAHLFQTRLLAYLGYSAALAALTGVGVAALGVGAAWLVALHRFPGRDFFDWALMLPLAAPAYLLAYAYADLTSAAGPAQTALRGASGLEVGQYWFPQVRGLLGAGFVFAFCLYPYVYLIARRAFAEQAAPLIDAARTLGRGPLGVFRDVVLPLAWPAIAAGGALAVIETLADYGAVAHLGVPTLTAGVMRAWASAGEPVAAARLALVLLAFCAALFWIERRARGRRRVSGGARHRKAPQPRRLTGTLGWLAALACAAPIVVGLIVPAGRMALIALDQGAPDGLARAGLNSAILGAAAAAIAAAIALAVCTAARAGDRLARAAGRIAAAGYAVPGAVAALGALAFFAAMQNGLDALWRFGGAAAAPIALVGGLPALLLAYQTRFAAAALGPVGSALERIAPNLDSAARTLGEDPTGVARRVHWPLARAGVVSAGLLVFVEVLKELPATMILRPFNFDTLAVMAHAYAADERLAQAAAPALAIPLLAAIPLGVAARMLKRADEARA